MERPLYNTNARKTLCDIRDKVQMDTRMQRLALITRLRAKAIKRPPRELIAQMQRLHEHSVALQLTAEETAVMHTLIASGAPTQLWDRLTERHGNTPLTFAILNRTVNSFNAADGSKLKWVNKAEDDMVTTLRRQLRELREQNSAHDQRLTLQASTGAHEPCGEGICNYAHSPAPFPFKEMTCRHCFQVYGPDHKPYGKCSNVERQIPQIEIQGKFYPRIPYVHPGMGKNLSVLHLVIGPAQRPQNPFKLTDNRYFSLVRVVKCAG